MSDKYIIMANVLRFGKVIRCSLCLDVDLSWKDTGDILQFDTKEEAAEFINNAKDLISAIGGLYEEEISIVKVHYEQVESFHIINNKEEDKQFAIV